LKRKQVVWTARAAKSLTNFCEFIKQDSPSAAKKVRSEILLTAKKLSDYPEMFQIDEMMGDPELNIRRFFKWNYKIV
jgi:plasmid stabilization system protein ParE